MRRFFGWLDQEAGRPTNVPIGYWRFMWLGTAVVAVLALLPYWLYGAHAYGPYGRLVYLALPAAFFWTAFALMSWRWPSSDGHRPHR